MGHKEAYEYVCSLVGQNQVLSERTIKDIHYLVLNDKKEDRGVYRKVPVKIMGSSLEPTQPYMVESKMQ